MTEAVQKYEQEQAQLNQDIRIEPPKQVEVNPEVLKDVEPMLFRGFLCVSAEINGVSFVFKTLNHHEFELLHLLVDPGDQRGVRRFYNHFLAYGVLMVDGVNILPDRDQYLPELIQVFGALDERVRRKVIRHMSEINRRASKAVVLTEVYSLESASRLRWSQYHKVDLTSPSVTGFAGTQNLGLNWAQLTWRAVNYYEDQREVVEREWENAKFIAGAFAGSKGLSPINSQDKQRRERERNERTDRRDKILRSVVLGEDTSGKSTPEKVAPLKVARTVEELADQLEKDLRGEKDWHDRVVDAHYSRIREQQEHRKQQLQEIRDAHVAQYGDKPIIGGTEVVGLSQEDVTSRIQERRRKVAQRLTSQGPKIEDPKMAHFYEKWTNLRRPSERSEQGDD